MGVCGSGKSTVGEAAAERLGATYLDGDSFHPPSNIEKMSAGTPLTDEDRWPWLERVAQEIAARPGIVLGGCSALKRAYRDHISRHAGEPVKYIHLQGSRELILSRMGQRTGHFMPTTLVDSQFAALEVPGDDELAVNIDIDADFDTVVGRIVAAVEGG
ncbi:MAG: gluconokinase [Rhodobiaceae bacterium]|nr:gluconokinase [Rhodobiaceae bacterium]